MLGRRYELKNGKSVEVVDCCYDIPLLKSLQLLLATDVVHEQVYFILTALFVHVLSKQFIHMMHKCCCSIVDSINVLHV